jgi:hypothetical protein
MYGILLLLAPIVIFLMSLPFSSRLQPRLSLLYRIVGAIIVFAGSSTSLYFAFYSGDQGGIAAFYFQIVVLLVYVMFSIVLLTINGVMKK